MVSGKSMGLGSGTPGGSGRDPPARQETQVQSPSQEVPWRREGLPTPLFLPGEFHGQRSMVAYSAWGHKQSDTTERLTLSLYTPVFAPRALLLES